MSGNKKKHSCRFTEFVPYTHDKDCVYHETYPHDCNCGAFDNITVKCGCGKIHTFPTQAPELSGDDSGLPERPKRLIHAS